MNRTIHNSDRARWAAQALHAFRIASGDDDDDATICDLIADLGHYADRHDVDFLDVVSHAVGCWAGEKKDPNSADLSPQVTIRIGQGGEP